MLKTIRKTIVGMMNRLRMAISLKPRLAEAEPGSSLASIKCSPYDSPAACRSRDTSNGKRGRPEPSPPITKRLLQQARLAEGLVPVVGDAGQRLFGATLVADDEGMQALVHRIEQFRVLRHRPEILDHEHGLVERLVVRSRLAEVLRLQHFCAAGVAAQFRPLLLHVVLDEPLQELHRLVLLLRVLDNRDALPAECREAFSGGAFGIGEVAGDLGVLVGRRIGQRREESEEVHAHRRQAFGNVLVVFQEEHLAPAGRGVLVQLLVELQRVHRGLAVDDALDLVGLVIAEIAAVAEQHVLVTHDQGIVAVVGVDGDAIALLAGTMEELGYVAHVRPGLRHAQVIAVLLLECGLFLRVIEPVFAIRPAGRIAFEGNGPVVLAALWVLGIALDGRRRHALVHAMLLEEIGELHVVTPGGTRAQPLGIADHQIVGIALGGEFAERLGLEIGPWRGFDLDRYAGLLFVVLDQFLQVVRRVPLGPEDGQFFRCRRRTAGQSENSAGQQAGPFLLAHLILLHSALDILLHPAVLLEPPGCTLETFAVLPPRSNTLPDSRRRVLLYLYTTPLFQQRTGAAGTVPARRAGTRFPRGCFGQRRLDQRVAGP